MIERMIHQLLTIFLNDARENKKGYINISFRRIRSMAYLIVFVFVMIVESYQLLIVLVLCLIDEIYGKIFLKSFTIENDRHDSIEEIRSYLNRVFLI